MSDTNVSTIEPRADAGQQGQPEPFDLSNCCLPGSMVIAMATDAIIDKLPDTCLAYQAAFAYSAIRKAIEAENGERSKSDKLSLPDGVPTYTAARLVAKRMHVVNIIPNAAMGNRTMGMTAIYSESGPTEGTYIELDKNDAKSPLRDAALQINPGYTSSWYTNFVDKVFSLAEDVTEEDDPDIIAVNNGLFNYKTKELLPFSPESVHLSKLATSMPNSAPPEPRIELADGKEWRLSTTLEEIMPDEDTNRLIYQIIGACCRPSVRWDKLICFLNENGNNGKGTILQLIRNLVGQADTSNLPISTFGKSFGMEPIIGKKVNLADENNVGQYLDSMAELKAIITHDPVSVNRKGKPIISYQSKMVMIQCLNSIPKVKDKSGSMERRLLIVPFSTRFTEDTEVREIKEDYIKRKEVLEWLLYHVLVEMDEYYRLEDTELTRSCLDDYKMANDPAIVFWDEYKDAFVNDFLPVELLYELFKRWFAAENPKGKCLAQQTFTKTLKQHLESDGWTFIDGNTTSKLTTKAWFLSNEPAAWENVRKLTLNNYDKQNRSVVDPRIEGNLQPDPNDKLTKWCDVKYYLNNSYNSHTRQDRGFVRTHLKDFCDSHGTNPSKFIDDHFNKGKATRDFTYHDAVARFHYLAANGQLSDDVEFGKSQPEQS